MKNRLYQCIFLLISCFIFCSAAQAAASTLPPSKKPIQVKVGLYLNDILSINERTKSMLFNAQLTLRWKDMRLKPGDYSTGAAKKLLLTIWHPQIELVGVRGSRSIRMLHLSIDQRGIVTWKEQFETSSAISMNLRQFPFDRQNLKIRLEPFAENASQIQLLPFKKYSGIAGQAHLEGWRVLGSSVRVSDVKNPIYHTLFSQYILSIRYERLMNYYIYQLFIPILLIVLLSFSVFWMLNNPLVNRVAISLTAVLTIVVFQWRILSKLPRVNYHTFAGVFMLASFIVAASTVVASIVLDHIESDSRRMIWVRASRIGYPALYLLVVLLIALFYI